MLNLVTFELQQYLLKDNFFNHNSFDFFDNLELLNGRCLCNFHLDKEPAKIKMELKKTSDRVRSYGNKKN